MFRLVPCILQEGYVVSHQSNAGSDIYHEYHLTKRFNSYIRDHHRSRAFIGGPISNYQLPFPSEQHVSHTDANRTSEKKNNSFEPRVVFLKLSFT